MKAALLLLALASAPANDIQQWLALAREAHAAADRDADQGRGKLAVFLATRPPPGVTPDDVRKVRQDALFHLAEADLRVGRPDQARDDASWGLKLGQADDLFTANLLIVRGRARELMTDDRGAVADYSEAQRINEALLRAETGGQR